MIPSQSPSFTPDEIFLINLIREKKFQEILIKIQDGGILSIARTERFIKKKGGLANHYTS